MASMYPAGLIARAMLAVLLLHGALLAPIAMAAGDSHQTAQSEHCPDQMPSDSDDCPCCPDGSTMSPGCMTQCAMFTASVGESLPQIRFTAGEEIPLAASDPPTLVYSPPNPPPIR